MNRLEVSGAVRLIYGSLGVKRIITNRIIIHKCQHKYIREIKVNALAYILLHVSTIKSPSSGRSKYKVINNKHTQIYLYCCTVHFVVYLTL